MKRRRTKELQPQPEPINLPAPHFDDIAVAIAQPVEPIVRQRDLLAILETPRMIVSMLIVAALLGSTALALTLQLRHQPQATTAATEVSEESGESLVYGDSAQPEQPLGGVFPLGKLRRARNKPRTINSRVITIQARPVARRVGVIYGSDDRP